MRLYLRDAVVWVLIHNSIHHGLMLQSAMARVCSASHNEGVPEYIELTMSEQAALKAEGKRLRRAAENGVFAILGSTSLLRPVMQWYASDGTSTMSGSIATNASENSNILHKESSAGAVCMARRDSCISSGPLRDRLAINPTLEATLQHTMEQGSVAPMPSHCSGNQVREFLNRMLQSGAASVGCSSQDAGSRKRAASIPNTLPAMQPEICVDDVHEQNKPINNQTAQNQRNATCHVVAERDLPHRCGTLLTSPGTLMDNNSGHAVIEVPALEGRILQIQQDLAEVCLGISHVALYRRMWRWHPQQWKGRILCRSWQFTGHS